MNNSFSYNVVTKSRRGEASRSLRSRSLSCHLATCGCNLETRGFYVTHILHIYTELLIRLLFVLNFIATQLYLYKQKLTDSEALTERLLVYKAVYTMDRKLMERVSTELVVAY